MSRREFLSWLGAASLPGCASPPPPLAASPSPAPPEIRAVAFDLFTLFDPRAVDQRVAAVVGDEPAFAATWKAKLFEYSWLRAAADQYRDFERLLHDAMSYAARAHEVTLTDAARATLANAFVELPAWPDSSAVLQQLRARGLKLAPLANFTPSMIERLLGRARLLDHFDALISTDRARTYKPSPRAYALGEAVFGVPREHIAFSAFGAWDAAGAHWFGFRSFWVNRLSRPSEGLGFGGASGSDLGALAQWISAPMPELSRPGAREPQGSYVNDSTTLNR